MLAVPYTPLTPPPKPGEKYLMETIAAGSNQALPGSKPGYELWLWMCHVSRCSFGETRGWVGLAVGGVEWHQEGKRNKVPETEIWT